LRTNLHQTTLDIKQLVFLILFQ